MPKRNNEYTFQEIEIADFIFANPAIEPCKIVTGFVSKFQRTERTIWNYYKKALEYNKIRLQKMEEIKEESMSIEQKEAIKNGILSRIEAIAILCDIAKGNARQIGDTLQIPTDADRTRAIQQLAKMEGWEAAREVTINNSFLELMAKASTNK